MKKLLLLAISLTLLFSWLLVACVKPISEEQRIIDAFNKHAYGFTLSYSDGRYELSPDTKISASDIQKAVEGKAWRQKLAGHVDLTEFSEHPFEGEANTVITISGNTAHFLSKPEDPQESAITWDESVSYGDNLICMGESKWIVCSINSGKINYLVKTNDDNYWLYACLEAQ